MIFCEPRFKKTCYLYWGTTKTLLGGTFAINCLWKTEHIRNVKHLVSFCSCAGWLVSYLVEILQFSFDRFLTSLQYVNTPMRYNADFMAVKILILR